MDRKLEILHFIEKNKEHAPVNSPPLSSFPIPQITQHFISFTPPPLPPLTCTRNQEMRTETQGFPLPEIFLAGDRTLPAGQDEEEEEDGMNKAFNKERTSLSS